MADHDPVNVLIVDDKPDKLLTLEAVLSDLPLNIIKAESGRDALRWLLKRDVAVILLDVNMPGMDGFETARLIRQRPSTEHTPILFITAYSDDMQVTQGYSLGAVDYILAPVVPEVLKTKVRVFIDLYRATLQVKRQARRLEQRAAQLHQLNQASLAINSTLSLDRMLQLAADTACTVIGARQSALIDVSDEGARRRTRVTSPATQTDNGSEPAAPSALEMRLVSAPVTNTAVRFTPQDLERLHPSTHANGHAPRESMLVAPLTSRDGRKIGILCVTGKIDGDFTHEDEALLSQLAQMTAVALENTLFAEAREANRVKEEFLATLSHELRTPLTAMLGWTQLLRAGTPDAAEVAHGLEIIERNVRAQAKLIDDLLEVSRIVAGKLRLNMQPVVLPAVIGAALDVVRPAAEAKGLHMEADIDTETGVLLGDPDRLQQVVWNLLANAVKFTPAGGSIHVGLRQSGPEATITIRDTGQGIPASFLPYLFDRFRQADSSSTRHYGGLGIGLALVRHLVELHGGHVSAESAGEGRGAVFTVTLPVQAISNVSSETTDPDHAAEGTSLRPEVSLMGLRVLVVDDEPDARDVLSRSLQSYGAEVHLACSAYEALECLDKVLPHVLVADIGMPDMDGYSLIRCLRRLPAQEGGAVPAVALTAFVRDEDRRQALAAGFQLHAAKPITPGELALLVGSLAGRGGQARPASAPVPASRNSVGLEGCFSS